MNKKGYIYLAVYKPYMMLCQFSKERPGDLTLKDLPYSFPGDIYPVGRLDKDSEGLLLLTNDNYLKTKYLEPKTNVPKTYLVQVEGAVTEKAIQQLSKGVTITVNGKPYKTGPAKARVVDAPQWLPERNPPIRYRKNIPDSWAEITITEGKNRQIRKMTAQTGFPTLRLIRVAIGNVSINNLQPGDVIEIKKPATGV